MACILGAPSVWTQTDDVLQSSVSFNAVRYHVEPGRTRVWFETSGTVLYTQYSPDPLTLVVDLPGVDVSGIAERTVIGSREVESILVKRLEGVNGKSLSRVEIKLGSLVPYQISASQHALTVLFEGVESDTPEPPSPGLESLMPNESGEPIGDGEAETIESTDLMEPARTNGSIDEDKHQEAPAKIVESQSSETLIETQKIESPTAVDYSPLPAASFVQSVTHSVDDGLLTVTVDADGRLNYTSFRLDNPSRLVFDFNDVTNRVRRANVDVGALGVSRIRIAQFRSASPRITRLVFDLDGDVPHRAVERGESIEIMFASTSGRLADAFPEPVQVASMDPSIPLVPDNGGMEGNSGADSYGSDGVLGTEQLEQMGATDSAYLQPVAVVAQSPLSELPGDSPTSPPSASLLPSPPPEADALLQDPQQLMPSFESQTIASEAQEYTGELISLDFKDGDIQDIFRLFSDISGLNIVVQPGVTGRITLKLVEVPWDQALELILKTHKLGFIVEGNVVRIAPLSELADEEAERRRLAEEKALSGELNTMTRPLSYAKVTDVQALLRKNLSPRGDVEVDERTNTLIITDLAEQLEAMNALIDTLDTPIPGVEIEARVVVTTRSFSRQFGIQWGFTGTAADAYGNTTELSFPNNYLVDGQSIGSEVAEEFRSPGPTQGGGTGGTDPPTIGADNVQRGYAVNLPFAGSPTGAIGISLGSITGAFGIDAALTAAESRGQARILSAPRIITQNNQEAVIKQGITFPVQTVANNTVTVTFKDAVLELRVTPQITSSNTIILDIQVNNDEADFSRTVNGIPSILTQEATTQVLVADGSTTVIGGVFKNTVDNQNQYVPLLHKIPILGHLFKNTSKTEENRELLIFMTPRIRKEVPIVVGG
jgi:type IV pilus assembly protein PilQ